MRKIYATIIKEWLLMKRDFAGAMLLLLMPAALIVVMAQVQDAPFRDYQDIKFSLLVADEDGGAVSKEIINGLKQSGRFNIIETSGAEKLAEEDVKAMLQKGDYPVGIVIPKGASAEVANAANILANSLSKKLGAGTMPVRERRDRVYVKVYFDPLSKPAFRTSLNFALDRFITSACSNLLVARLSTLSKAFVDSSSHDDGFTQAFAGIGAKETPINDKGKGMSHLSSVQHNVPAWAIFGMFFIVVPISSHMIREREDGSAIRLALIPNTGWQAILGRVLFYTLVCTFQFWIMVALGKWLLPFTGLPSLYLGLHAWALLPVALVIGFAATCYGILCGVVFKTTNQAMPFGAISVVILSALSGLWVPIELLPKALQQIAVFSPLHWALNAIHTIILRDGSFADIAADLFRLFLLGLAFYAISLWKAASIRQSGGY
jgi:ABC-2 type transport system permease protein